MKKITLLFLVLFLNVISCSSVSYNDNPLISVHYYNIGLRKARKGNYQEAIPFFRRALEVNPNSICAREQLAIAHCHLGDEFMEWRYYKKAIIQYKIALGLNPDLAEARRGLRDADKHLQVSTLGKE